MKYWCLALMMLAAGCGHTPPPPPPPPPAMHQVTLAIADGDSVDHFNIYRGQDCTSYQLLASVKANQYVDKALTPGESVCYVATAVGQDGMESVRSNSFSAVVPTP